GFDVLAAGYAESYRQGEVGATTHAGQELRQVRGHLDTSAGYAGHADTVDEAARVLRDDLEPVVAGRGRHEEDQVEAGRPEQGLDRPGLIRWQVDKDHPVDAGSRRVG